MTMTDTKTKTSGDNLQNAILEIKRNRGQISSNWLEEAPSKATMTMKDTKTKEFGEHFYSAILQINRNRGQISSNWLEEAPSKATQS